MVCENVNVGKRRKLSLKMWVVDESGMRRFFYALGSAEKKKKKKKITIMFK